MTVETMRAPSRLRRRRVGFEGKGSTEVQSTERKKDFSSFRMQGIHFASFFIAPVIMLGKTFTSLYKLLVNTGAFGLSVFTTVWTLGQWRQSIKIVEKSFFGILQNAGEAAWSVLSLAAMEVMFLLGAVVHPNIPFLATDREM